MFLADFMKGFDNKVKLPDGILYSDWFPNTV